MDLGAWASEKYVVSEPVFNEEEIAEEDRRKMHEPRKSDDSNL